MGKIKKEHVAKGSYELAKTLCQAAVDSKAEKLVVLDVRGLTYFTDYFVIMSGRSTRHVQGLASALEKEMNRKRLKNTNSEGFEDGQWILLDFDDVIVHVFYDETRQFYDLEGLWHDAPRIDFDLK